MNKKPILVLAIIGFFNFNLNYCLIEQKISTPIVIGSSTVLVYGTYKFTRALWTHVLKEPFTYSAEFLKDQTQLLMQRNPKAFKIAAIGIGFASIAYIVKKLCRFKIIVKYSYSKEDNAQKETIVIAYEN